MPRRTTTPTCSIPTGSTGPARAGLLLLLGSVVATLATTCLLGPPGAAAGEAPVRPAVTLAWEPPPHTVVHVSGDRDDGFTVERYDGSVLYPPTLSEARAECAAYATRVRRVRCRTEVRVSYRDLGGLKRSLRWAAHQSAGQPAGQSAGQSAGQPAGQSAGEPAGGPSGGSQGVPTSEPAPRAAG